MPKVDSIAQLNDLLAAATIHQLAGCARVKAGQHTLPHR
jgi:hypothetical protein